MSRVPMDEEQNSSPLDLELRDILTEYWVSAGQEQSAPSPSWSPSPNALSALQAEEQEEGVRIYQPKRFRADQREALAPDPTLAAEPEPEPEPEPEKPQAPQPRYAQRVAPINDVLTGLLNRFGRGRAPAEPEPAPAPDPAELPSFEELIWGEKKKKKAPVRIVEDEDEPVKPAPAPRPVPEVQIPETELMGLTVDAILSEYWGGLTEEEAPRAAAPAPAIPVAPDRKSVV